MGLSFLNPILLAGLAALAVPIILHAFSQRKAPRMEFGAMAFLLKTQRRVQQRFRFHKILLLLIRLLIILTLVLLFSRPQFVTALVDPAMFKPASRVLILDNSMSMGWAESKSLLDNAKDRARRIVESMRGDDNAAVIASQSVPSESELLFDKTALERQIQAIELQPYVTDFQDAFDVAQRLLGQTALELRQIIVLTDMTAAGWEGSRTGFLQNAAWREAGVELILIDVTEGEELSNLYIDRIKTGRKFHKGESETQLEIAVESVGPRPSEARAEWRMDGKKILEGAVDTSGESPHLASLSRIDPPMSAEERRGREGRATIQISGDRLVEDNRRYFNLENRSLLRILIVDGDWQANPYRTESFYLDKALEPMRVEGSVEANVIPLEALADATLDDRWDVVFLLDPPNLSASLQTDLQEYVRQGGGLVLSVGEQTDPLQANSYLRMLLPHPLRGARAYGDDSDSQPNELPSIQPPGRLHPFFFGYDETNLASAEFETIMLLEEGLDPDAALLRFSNGLPALAEKTIGDGKVLLFLSSMDRAWNDFPIKTAFLPLIDRMSQYLSGDLQWPLPNAAVGDFIALDALPQPAEDFDLLEIWSPAGVRLVGVPRDGLEHSRFSPETAGFYRIQWLMGAQPVKSLAWPINVDRTESDLTRVDWDALKPKLEEAFAKLTAAEASDKAANPAWLEQTVRNRALEATLLKTMLALLALLLATESFLLRRPV